MKTNPLGRTGLAISEIAFGGGVTGGILITADEATRQAALARAVAGGINWIDTAALYGDGASEETIGRYFPSLTPRPCNAAATRSATLRNCANESLRSCSSTANSASGVALARRSTRSQSVGASIIAGSCLRRAAHPAWRGSFCDGARA